ncbi:MAG: CoA-binding protein [Hyphomicrobium sp.]|uniref:CoA-binding protein n=1 Tax=Hyphomicrobium sp. TaxID=82 RepID=UPI0039E6CC77
MMRDGLDDATIRAILTRVKTIAMVGASPKPERPSHGVMRFLLDRGYIVRPVNQTVAGKTILDQFVYASLADVPPPIDLIDIFRAPEAALAVVREAIAEKDRLGISVIWMQLGVINEEAAALVREAGLTVVMDRCPKIEFARLMRG